MLYPAFAGYSVSGRALRLDIRWLGIRPIRYPVHLKKEPYMLIFLYISFKVVPSFLDFYYGYTYPAYKIHENPIIKMSKQLMCATACSSPTRSCCSPCSPPWRRSWSSRKYIILYPLNGPILLGGSTKPSSAQAYGLHL